MIAILSPAKNMRAASREGLLPSRPDYLEQAGRLNALLREYDPWQLESLLKIGPKLAIKAHSAIHSFDPAAVGTPAALAYQGLAYSYLDADSFDLQDFAFADSHLRLMSAFYGMLRPTDGIHPYRLDLMGKLRVNGDNLYQFWGECLYRDLFREGQPVINLCSGEFSKLLTPFLRPEDKFITCDFLVNKGGRLRCVTTTAKMARGRMARYIIQNRLQHPHQLREFDWQGFRFVSERSSEDNYLFVLEG